MVTIADEVEQVARSSRTRFVVTIFVGSFLLFLVQPMIARMALPRLGGAPSVWNSAMLVYQALLLAGYAYAHWLGRFRPPRQAMIHVAALVLAGLTLPIGLMSGNPPPDANPFLWVPWLLLLSIGPLFFVVSAQAPLLQRWFALTKSGDPYPLYAASNLGSFGGLITYPLLVEPLLPVGQQRWLWSLGYALLLLLVGWCAIGLPKSSGTHHQAADAGPAPSARQIVAVDPARRGALGPDPVDDAAHHHRHHRHAAAVGDSARRLSAELHRRVRGQARAGQHHHPPRAADPAARLLRHFHGPARAGAGLLRRFDRQPVFTFRSRCTAACSSSPDRPSI